MRAGTVGNTSLHNASRFWNTLDLTRGTVSEPEQVVAWEALSRRRQSRRGLPDRMVNDELATVMLHPNMEMWNLSQVELFFLKQTHPDWEKWDMISEICAGVDEQSTAANIGRHILGMSLEETFTLDVIEGMRDRLNKWRDQSTRTAASIFEADLVNSYWRKEKVWRAYQVCNFRTRVLVEYREALSTFSCHRLRVSLLLTLQKTLRAPSHIVSGL